MNKKWRFNWGWEDASGTDHVRCGEGMAESSVPVGSWLWRGNPAGMNSYGDRLHFSKRIAVLNSWETSFSAWIYRRRENSIALGSKEPHQVAKNKFRTKFEKTSLSAQSFWWRCVSGKHPFTFRTRWLRPRRPMVLYWWRYGRVGGCQIKN